MKTPLVVLLLLHVTSHDDLFLINDSCLMMIITVPLRFFLLSAPLTVIFVPIRFRTLRGASPLQTPMARKLFLLVQFFFWFSGLENFRRFRDFFQSFREFLKVFGCVWTFSDLFGPLRIHSNAFGCFRKRSSVLDKFSKILHVRLFFQCLLPAHPRAKFTFQN